MKHNGSALITALFIMAIVAIAATAMALRLQIEIRRTNLTLNADRSYAFAQGVAYWAAGELIDRQKKKLLDPKIQNIVIENYENARVMGSIEDMQSRFNINNLANQEKEKQLLAIETFTRLIKLVAPDVKQAPEIAEATAYWVSSIKSGLKPTSLDFYKNVKPPYAVAYQPMVSISELRLVAGITPKMYRQLLPWVFALPNETASEINLNTATKEILMTLDPKFTPEMVEEFIRKRDAIGGFKTREQLQKESLLKINGTLKSNYFLVHAHVELDKITQDIFTLLKRQENPPFIITLWESRGSI